MTIQWEGDTTALIAALVKAQTQMETATKGAANSHFKSKYADLATVLECIVPALNANGVALLQTPGWDASAGLVTMTTILAHESGGMMTSTASCELGRGSGPQALGSAITYLRRFTAKSVLALPEEDDDGNAAQGTVNGQRRGPAPIRSFGDVPSCPACDGLMWDNRESKKDNPKRPDFKCRDKVCGKAVWLDTKSSGWSDAERGRYYATLKELRIHKDLVKEYIHILNMGVPVESHRPMPKDMTNEQRNLLLDHLSGTEGRKAIAGVQADLEAEMSGPHSDEDPEVF